MDNLRKTLLSLKEDEYADFQRKLIPNIDKNRVLGVRLPVLRDLAKKTDAPKGFLNALPHEFLEENLLHAFYIEKIKDIDVCLEEVDKFLPFIDNWAVSDTFSPKVFKKNLPKIHEKALEWIKSDREYVVRYGVLTLMRYFLGEGREKDFLLVASLKREEYYVKMMVAWYFATALCKEWDIAINVLRNRLLDKWTHNKTIRKAIESYRISKEQKEYLRSLTIK